MKLIDFGLARKLGPGELAQTKAGTLSYMAPEFYEDTGHNLTVDWWAVGILIFELMFGNNPFFSSKISKLIARIRG